MNCGIVRLTYSVLSLLLLGFLLCLFFPEMARAATVATLLDGFDGTSLNLTKWFTFPDKVPPTVSNGELHLHGEGATQRRAEIQSIQRFRYLVLQAAIRSSDWQSQTSGTDSSFGVEVFTGANGQCHYGALLKANGHLDLLRSVPDAAGNCFGDPMYQRSLALSNWDNVRAGERVVMTLTLTSRGVTLAVSSGTYESLRTASPITGASLYPPLDSESD